MNAKIRRDIDRIARQFDDLYGFSEVAELRVERISKWSVAQHLHHLMKSDRSIFEYFPAPDEGPIRPVTTVGRIVLWTGWIPRGKGRAPNTTQPEAPGSEEIAAEVATSKSLFDDSIEPPETLLEPRAIAQHPVFGSLNRAQWLRFVAVHHHHHIKIIRDVMRADPS